MYSDTVIEIERVCESLEKLSEDEQVDDEPSHQETLADAFLEEGFTTAKDRQSIFYLKARAPIMTN
jgi:hypothetical protein